MPRNQSKLEAAREFERAQAAKIPASERPLFHLTPMVGWMNDPNGFCYYNGEYHLFYQYNPYSTVWGPMHWGHAVTTDLLHWTWQPAALAPDTAADAGGCFSGTAVETPDGQLLLMYTGVQPASTGHAELQAQCVAIGNGVDFRKVSQNPVLDASALPAGYSAVDFRDPKIWRENDKYYCAAGNRHETRQGSILLFESPDALHWTFVTELDSSDNEYGRMWECPDFFPLDGKQLLLVSPQEMQANRDGEFHAGYGTIALLGHWDAGTRTFTREQVQPIDHGLDFYAPQTTLAPDGRRIMVGWMVNWETCGSEPRVHPWFGRMSLPRELHLRHGRLYQTPVRELETLWKKETALSGVTVYGSQQFEGLSGRHVDMTVTVDVDASPACRRFELRFAGSDRFFTEVRCNLTRGELVFDRSRSGSRRDIPHTRHITAASRQGKLTLRLVLDGESAELFINDGERALSALLETPPDAQDITFRSDGPVKLDILHHTLG